MMPTIPGGRGRPFPGAQGWQSIPRPRAGTTQDPLTSRTVATNHSRASCGSRAKMGCAGVGRSPWDNGREEPWGLPDSSYRGGNWDPERRSDLPKVTRCISSIHFLKDFYVFIHERHGQREKKAPRGEPHTGLNPGAQDCALSQRQILNH